MSFFKTIWGDYFFSMLVLMIGLAASVGAAWTYQKNWSERITAEFEDAASDRLALIRSEIEHNNVVLASLAAFYYASKDVSYEEFHVYSQQLLKDSPFIRAVIWVPAVPAAERSAYERAAQKWKPDFQFVEAGEDKLIPAKTRETYFPIYYAEPNMDNTYLGFDYASEPHRFETLQQAQKLRQISASEKISLLRTGETGVLFAYPIFHDTSSSERLKGFVVSVVALQDLIEAALKPLSYAGVNIVVHDMSAPHEEDRMLYARSTRLKKIPAEEIIEDYVRGDRMKDSAIMNVAGRQWEVTVQSARGYFDTGLPRISFVILACGVVFSSLLFFFMFSRISENDRIGRKVGDRTSELQQAKSQIETILFSTKDGIIGMDREEKITFCNPMAASLLGYFKRDMMGASYQKLLAPTNESGEKSSEAESMIRQVLQTGEAVTVSDQLFWKRDGTSLQTEYTVSPIMGDADVEGIVLTFRDITERRKMEKELEKMARFDQLTGLANRAAFVEQLKIAISRARRTNKKVGVVYIDLNNFKPINDTLGHAAGDMMLKGFAERMRKSCREYDLPARLGGDEFTVLVDNLDHKDGAVRLVERLIENLKEPFKIYDKTYQMSGSIGIAFFPDDAETYDEVITHADSAMYAAKKNKGVADAKPYALFEK